MPAERKQGSDIMLSSGQIRGMMKALAYFILDYTEYSFAVGMIVMVMFSALMVFTVMLMLVASSQTGVDIASWLFELIKPLLIILFPEGIHFNTGPISVIEPFLILAFILTILGNGAKSILRRFGVEIKIGFFRKLIIVSVFVSACYLFLAIVVPGFETGSDDDLPWYLILGILYFMTMIFSGVSLVASAVADLIRRHMDMHADGFLIELFPDKK